MRNGRHVPETIRLGERPVPDHRMSLQVNRPSGIDFEFLSPEKAILGHASLPPGAIIHDFSNGWAVVIISTPWGPSSSLPTSTSFGASG
jgi:hypothetical protein